MSSLTHFDQEQRAPERSVWHDGPMNGSEWEQVVEQVRLRLAAHIDPATGVEQAGTFAKRIGVSRPYVVNFAAGRKTPQHEIIGRILEGLDLRVVDAAKGTSAGNAVVGTIDGTGTVLYSHEERMGRFSLIEDVVDHEKPLPSGAVLIVDPATQPAPSRWNLVRVDGATRLARGYDVGGIVLLRFAGERVRHEWTPEVHEVQGIVAWIMVPSD